MTTERLAEYENQLESLEYDLEIIHFQNGINSKEAKEVESLIKTVRKMLAFEQAHA